MATELADFWRNDDVVEPKSLQGTSATELLARVAEKVLPVLGALTRRL